MNIQMRRRRTRGFTLLEVLLATAIMAVGTTSVLVVIATAAGMASQRQVGVRREQVLDEARHDAQAMVDAFNPGAPNTNVQVIGMGKGKTKVEGAVKTAPDKVLGKGSSRFEGFSYDLVFEAKDRLVPEKGFDVAITLHYGGGDLSYGTTTSIVPTTIADSEFATSMTWQEEQKAPTDGGKTKESKK